MGFDAILLNLAVGLALSNDPISMAWARLPLPMRSKLPDWAIYEAGMIEKRNIAKDKTLLIDKPFFGLSEMKKAIV